MAKAKPEPTPEEIEERRERFDAFVAEEFVKPLAYLKFETDAMVDPKLYDLRCMCGGWKAAGLYVALALTLGRTEGHVFAVEDKATGRDRWALLASLMGPDVGVDELKGLAEAMYALGLLDRELYGEGRIAIRHITDNAYEAAEFVAKRRLGGTVGGRSR